MTFPLAGALLVLAAVPAAGQDRGAPRGGASAYEAYGRLLEGVFRPAGAGSAAAGVGDGRDPGAPEVFWTTRASHSSSLITRVASPAPSVFEKMVNGLPTADRRAFLRHFFESYVGEGDRPYRVFRRRDGSVIDLALGVKDGEGEPRGLDPGAVGMDAPDRASLAELTDAWGRWLSMTHGSPMSFLSPDAREDIFNGSAPGLAGEGTREVMEAGYEPGLWVPNLGRAQRYVKRVGPGWEGRWEIDFREQADYGEFERMISWFRDRLSRDGEDFEAPAFRRFVFPEPPPPKGRLRGLLNGLQALVVLDMAAKGKAGTAGAGGLRILPDGDGLPQGPGGEGERAVLSAGPEPGGGGRFGVTFWTGTDEGTARTVQTFLASRVLSGDFGGVEEASSWELVPRLVGAERVDLWVGGLGVPRGDALDAWRNLEALEELRLGAYDVFSWNWGEAPFLGERKRALVKDRAQRLVLEIANLPDPAGEGGAGTPGRIRGLVAEWVRGMGLVEEMTDLLRPRGAAGGRLPRFRLPGGNGGPDPASARHLFGVEYTARFPLSLEAEYEEGPDGKPKWVSTRIDLEDGERRDLFKAVAEDLMGLFGGTEGSLKERKGGTHGHDVGMTYAFTDGEGRSYVLDWDEVARSYSERGPVVEGSARGGYFEFATPKSVPVFKELDEMHRVFRRHGLLPSHALGGGHVNVDLAPFKGRPRALARFLSIFHRHRGIISLLFQDPRRMWKLKWAPPQEVGADLARALADFHGDEWDLKRALYDARYFNDHEGYKSRYSQLNIIPYLQEVIPDRYLGDDFDAQNPRTDWRQQFRVRKGDNRMEFRLFNAPRDAFESMAHISLVQAMLDKALDEDGPLDGSVQAVDHARYVRDPGRAYADLAALCDDLRLDEGVWRNLLAEALDEASAIVRSMSLEQAAEGWAPRGAKERDWGEAKAPPARAAAPGVCEDDFRTALGG